LVLALKSKGRQATDAMTVSQFVAAYGVTNDVVRSIAIERDNPRPGNPWQVVPPAHSKTFGRRRQVMTRSEATSALGWCGAAVAAVVLLIG
jgi:hypothetical protein